MHKHSHPLSPMQYLQLSVINQDSLCAECRSHNQHLQQLETGPCKREGSPQPFSSSPAKNGQGLCSGCEKVRTYMVSCPNGCSICYDCACLRNGVCLNCEVSYTMNCAVCSKEIHPPIVVETECTHLMHGHCSTAQCQVCTRSESPNC